MLYSDFNMAHKFRTLLKFILLLSTKGSVSRKKSKELAMKLSMKPGRKCGNCLEIGHHDSRNCKKGNEKARQRQ